jgi:tetratricopeptide (TPR) repeat protein
VADVIKCPNCGELGQTVGEKCAACDNPVVIKAIATVMAMPMPQINKYIASYREQIAEQPDNKQLNGSIALCYLRLKLYDKALPCFEKAMEENFEDSTPFFYAAVCLLKGQKAFLMTRPVIDKILEYVNAALMIESRPIYHYFLAYIKNDYFARKHLNVPPSFQEHLEQARQVGLTDDDAAGFFAMLGVERPVGL